MNPTDPALPPIVSQILAYAAIALGLLTGLAAGLRWLVPQLRVIASRTTTHADDAVVDWLARALAVIATVIDVAQVVLPRVSLGRPAAAPEGETRTVTTATVTRTEAPVVVSIPPTNPPPPMTGPGGAALVLVAALLWPALHGCGGAQQVSAGAACGSMYGLIAAHSDYTAERSAADLDSQRSICERLTADLVTP